jgi:hypothetical protein
MFTRQSFRHILPASAFSLALLLTLGACLPVASPTQSTATQTTGRSAAAEPPPPSAALPLPSAAPLPLATPALSTPAGASSAGSARLYVVDQVMAPTGTENRLRILDAASGTVERDLPFGFPSPDWSALFALDSQPDKTTVRKFDLATGKLIKQITLDGWYVVPADAFSAQPNAFSHDGRWLVLLALPSAEEEKTWAQSGHPRSRYLVLDTALTLPPRRVDLAGDFEFDALSGDGASLYLVEILDAGYPHNYSPARAPHYQVRLYDLANGELAPQPVVDKSDVEAMNGFRRTGVFSPHGAWLYSLYTRPDKGPFIHALNLTDKYAVCIDLPFPADGNFEKEMLWSLTLNAIGSRLYAVNGASGEVAEVDTSNGFQVTQSRTLPAPAAAVPNRASALLAQLGRWLLPAAEAKRAISSGAALSPDGSVLYILGDTGLLALNTAGLSLRGRYLAGLALNGLALSPDGARLYAVDGTHQPDGLRLLAIDPPTGAILGQVSGVEGPWAVLRVDMSQ